MTRSFPGGTSSVPTVRDVRLTCGIAESSVSLAFSPRFLTQGRFPQMCFARCSPGYTAAQGVAQDLGGLRSGYASDQALAAQARSRLSQLCSFMPLILRVLVSSEVR